MIKLNKMTTDSGTNCHESSGTAQKRRKGRTRQHLESFAQFCSVLFMCITVYPNKMMFQKTVSNKILPANFTTTVANINKITPQGKKFQTMGTGQARGKTQHDLPYNFRTYTNLIRKSNLLGNPLANLLR